MSGELITGLADCIFAFGQLLANKGLLDRAELAAAFNLAVKGGAAQQEERGGDVAARTAMARFLAEAFSMPLAGDRSGFTVITGGQEPPAVDREE